VAEDVYGETGNFSRGVAIGKGYGGTSTGANRLLVEGNVGIGTTSPVGKLHLYQSGSATNMIDKRTNISTNDYGQMLNYTHYSSVAQGANRDPDNSRGLWIGNMVDENDLAPSGANFVAFTNSFQFYVAGDQTKYDDGLSFTSNTDTLKHSGGNFIKAMHIDSDGKVGIGTTSPGTLLDVVGHPHTFIRKMAQAGTATNDYNHILGGPRPGTTSAGAVHFINGSARTSDGGTDTYTIRNDSGRLRLGNASFDTLLEGNVGIGVTSPSVALDISGQLNVSAGLKTIQLFNSNLTVSAGAWNDIGDFSGMSNGCYLLTVRWGNSSNPLVYWYGGASGVIYMRGDANASYNSQAGEDLRLNHWYHYRTAGEFEFLLDSDNATGNYGNTTLWVKAPAACTINFGTYMTLLDNV
jgi:hypothetical protein